jgi:hypothetical protein
LRMEMARGLEAIARRASGDQNGLHSGSLLSSMTGR